jgi:hypothetical protein
MGANVNTTLSDSWRALLELEHTLQVVRPNEEDVGGQDPLDDAADARKREVAVGGRRWR